MRVDAINSAAGFEVTADDTGRPARADLRAWLAGLQGRYRRHPDAAVLRDLTVLLAGGDCLSEPGPMLRHQPGRCPGRSPRPTEWRVIERVATDPRGLARIRAARAHARARAWAAGAHPAHNCC